MSNTFKAIVINPGERPIVKELSDDGIKAELNGGYLEAIRFTDASYAFLDEDGMRKRLQTNHLATYWCEILKVGLATNASIVGPFIIVGFLNDRGQPDGESYDVPQILIDRIVKPHEQGKRGN